MESEKSAKWNEGEWLEVTPVAASIEEELPTLTVAAVAGVTVVVLLAIAAVFILGLLLDCRQQRMIDNQKKELNRLKTQRRVRSNPKLENVSIVDNMEETSSTAPAADALRDVP